MDSAMWHPSGYPEAAKVRQLIFTPVTRTCLTMGEHAGQALEMGRIFAEEPCAQAAECTWPAQGQKPGILLSSGERCR